jgi:hypothetical protein
MGIEDRDWYWKARAARRSPDDAYFLAKPAANPGNAKGALRIPVPRWIVFAVVGGCLIAVVWLFEQSARSEAAAEKRARAAAAEGKATATLPATVAAVTEPRVEPQAGAAAEPCVDVARGEPMRGSDAVLAARTCSARGEACAPVLGGPPYTQEQKDSIARQWRVLSPLPCKFRAGGSGITPMAEPRLPTEAEIEAASKWGSNHAPYAQIRTLPRTESGFRRMVKEEFAGSLSANDAERRMQEYGMHTLRDTRSITGFGSQRSWDLVHHNTYTLTVGLSYERVHGVEAKVVSSVF